MALLIIATVSSTAISSVAAQSAARTLPDSVAPGEIFEVGIVATGYGMFGQVIETLPAGFSYVNSSLSAGSVTLEGQDVKFTLLGVTSFTYNVTAPSVEGTYTFSGILKDAGLSEYEVGGDKEIAVKSIAITFIPPTPENGTEISMNYMNVTVSIEAANPISTARLIIKNETAPYEVYTMTAFSEDRYYYNVTDLSNGVYRYVVHATDIEDNTGMSEMRVVTVTEFNPWSYDENGDGAIDKDEAMAAVMDYFDGKITKDQVMEVILLYFGA